MTKAKRRLKNIDFSGEGAHMALVGEPMGGAANGTTTLVMKSVGSDGITEEQLDSLTRIVMKSQGTTEEEAKEIVMKNFKLSTTNKGEHMSEETLTKAQVEQMLAEQIEKAQVSAKDETKAEYEEIVKGLKAEIEKFQEKEQQIQKAKYVEKAKGYEALGVTDDNAEDAAVALMKMAEDEELKVVGEMLEKALNIAKAAQAGAFEEHGHDLEVDNAEESGVMKALKARKESQK